MTCTKCGNPFTPPIKTGKGGRPRTRCDDCRGNIDRIDGTKWRVIREQILRGGPPCVRCGAPATEVDHIVPLSRGGDPYELTNLQPMCKPCNVAKGDRPERPRKVGPAERVPIHVTEGENCRTFHYADGTTHTETSLQW